MPNHFEADLNRVVAHFVSLLTDLAATAARAMVERAMEARDPALPASNGRRPPRVSRQDRADPFVQLIERLNKSPRRPKLGRARRDFERLYIERALEESGGNITHAARSLGIPRQSLQRRLQRLAVRGRRRRTPSTAVTTGTQATAEPLLA